MVVIAITFANTITPTTDRGAHYNHNATLVATMAATIHQFDM